MVDSNISISTFVRPGTGTGALSKRNIHVSISRTSWSTIDGIPSNTFPVNTDQTVSLEKKNYIFYFLSIPWIYSYGKNNPNLVNCFEAPTLLGLVFSLQPSINFFNMNKISRNVEKNGWWLSRHKEVKEWFLTLYKINKRKTERTYRNTWAWGKQLKKMSIRLNKRLFWLF